MLNISTGKSGCSPCDCHPIGGMRSDCQQTTGQCICQPNVFGDKCGLCWDGTPVASNMCPDIVDHSDFMLQLTTEPPFITTSLTTKSFEKTKATVQKTSKHSRTFNHTKPTKKPTKKPTRNNIKSSLQPKTKSTRLFIAENKTTISNTTEMGSISTLTFTTTLELSTTTTEMVTETTEPLIESDKAYSLPKFEAYSYMQLENLTHGDKDINIELDFRTSSANGLLLYIANKGEGRSDFLSIALNDAHVEFRYDLGSGSALLRSKTRVSQSKLHKISASRHGKDGLLKLDSVDEATGLSPGKMKQQDIDVPIFLGKAPSVPNSIKKIIGMEKGFEGCVLLLRIASSKINVGYELDKPNSQHVVQEKHIKDCDMESCDTVKCFNEGKCIFVESQGHVCQCVDGFTGAHCEIEEDYTF